MAFVNEYISEEEKKKHNFVESNHFYASPPTSWTVDHERNMFLVKRWVNAREPWVDPGITKWAFYWHGCLLDIEIYTIENGQDATETHGWTHKRINSIKGLPTDQKIDRTLIVNDLREAFTASKGRVVYSPYQTYTVTLDVE